MDRDAVYPDLPRFRFCQSCQQVEQCGFSRSAGSHDPYEHSFACGEADVSYCRRSVREGIADLFGHEREFVNILSGSESRDDVTVINAGRRRRLNRTSGGKQVDPAANQGESVEEGVSVTEAFQEVKIDTCHLQEDNEGSGSGFVVYPRPGVHYNH